MKKLLPILLCALLLCSCGKGESSSDVSSHQSSEPETSSQASSAELGKMDFGFTSNDKNTTLSGGTAEIKLSKNGASVSGNGASYSDGVLKITAEGSYKITGETSGCLEIDAADKKVQLILENAKIANATGPALYVKDADKVFLTLYGENTLSDGEVYSFSADDGADGAVFSRADLAINGSGSLAVTGKYKHAIVSKDDLVITGGRLNITSVNVGLEGKDCVKITDADIKVTAGSDGIRSTNAEDPARGYVYIESGNLDIVSENDGIQGETAVKIAGGTLNISAGGGSVNSSQSSSGGWNEGWMRPGGRFEEESDTAETTESAKGIKSSCEVVISGGEIELDTADDTVHSNQNVTITGGNIVASSGDDGVHADTALNISGGKIKLLKSYEGIEATDITISGGEIDIVASDDGLNAAGGADGSSMGGRPGMGGFSGQSGSIKISGGTIYVKASGDGVDSNGTITVSGGETYVSGPENSGNGALDYESSATVTGGTFIAVGASGMAQGFSSAENQGAINVNVSSTVPSGSKIELKNSSGKVLVAFTPKSSFSNIVISAAGITEGNTYTVYIDGNEVGDIEMDSLLYGSSGGMGGMGGPGGYGGGPRW
ncbi:MAG: carbohydrate-binding domain-containing protein [Clostridia bacterium]|nr:carbohydrate-binding domain-containing protein [Clostridia bacterium]